MTTATEITPEMIERAAQVIRSRCGDDSSTEAWAFAVAAIVLDAALSVR